MANEWRKELVLDAKANTIAELPEIEDLGDQSIEDLSVAESFEKEAVES